MAELNIQMHGKKKPTGERDLLFPVAKSFVEIDTNIPVDQRVNYRLYGLNTSNAPQGGKVKQLQNSQGETILPETSMDAVFLGNSKATDYLTTIQTVTIPTSAWSSAPDNTLGTVYTASGITVNGVLADVTAQEIKWQGKTYEDIKLAYQYQLIAGKQDANKLTFWASETPSQSITLLVTIQKIKM